ncbi:hypothetical protein MRX96_007520 [Rhipicephalus microplus]
MTRQPGTGFGDACDFFAGSQDVVANLARMYSPFLRLLFTRHIRGRAAVPFVHPSRCSSRLAIWVVAALWTGESGQWSANCPSWQRQPWLACLTAGVKTDEPETGERGTQPGEQRLVSNNRSAVNL